MRPFLQKHLLVLVLFISVSSWPAVAAEMPLPVVASFSILGDMAKTIGGDAVAVKTLVGPDADAHSYEPTPNDIKSVAAAKLLIVNGLSFEGWMDRIASTAGFKGKIVVASEGVMPRTTQQEDEDSERDRGPVHAHDHDHDHDHDHEGTDPHAWQNLAYGRIYVKNIAAALAEALPEQADAIHARAAKYDAELAALDAEIKRDFAAVPAERRKIITSHDAFGYFGDAYGIAFLAPVGMTTEAEASAADLAALIAQIKREQVKTVFLENMNSSRLISQIAKDTGAQVGSTLYADALSAPDGPASTYIAMFHVNAAKLLTAMRKN